MISTQLSLDYLQQALDIFCAIGDRRGQANARLALGEAQQTVDAGEADLACRQALETFRALGDRDGQARTLATLAWQMLAQGLPEAGHAYADEAVEIYRQIGDRLGQGYVYGRLGLTLILLDNPAEGVPIFEHGVLLLEEIHHTLAPTWRAYLAEWQEKEKN